MTQNKRSILKTPTSQLKITHTPFFENIIVYVLTITIYLNDHPFSLYQSNV